MYGPNPTYEALTLTVTCQVTSVAPPAAPSVGDASLTYTVYDASNVSHDYTASTWVQTPPCGYAVSNNFSWDGHAATTAITVDASSSVAALSIFSTKKADAGSYPIKLSNTLTIANNGPGGNTVFTPALDADKTVFTIIIVDPCETAIIDAL